MPANVSQAAFQPISPWLNLDELVEKTDNFQYVTRVSLETIEAQGPAALNRLITLHVLVGGKPLVIEGFHKKLPRHLFSHGWLDENKGLKAEQTRDLTRGKNLPMTINNYLKHMSKLTEQWWLPKGTRAADEGQRLYLKDIDCPEAWHSYLAALIPPTLFYLNESTGDIGGPASVDEQAGPFGSTTKGKGIAPAGDLMSSLSPEMRAENMMCYIGHEGTYTPSHREMCATLGHNLMVETSGNGVDKWGKRERAGSSIWFMTETKDRYQVSEYWLSVLGHDIEIENHFAQVNAWKLAPFRTYIVEQKAGDFILIPPLAPHQVWNRGTRTMKVAWNRTSVETLELALNEALPRARMVCRDEQYKCKAILFFTLEKYYNLLRRIDPDYSDGWGAAAMAEINRSRKIFQLKKDYRRLFNLFTDVMLGEMFSSDRPQEKKVEMLEFDGNVTCAFCRCNIFNRFLTCKSCIISNDGGEDDAYDVCMECYAMGRSCWCQSGLKWVQQFPWDKLLEKYEDWRQMAIRLDGVVNESSPQRLSVARQRRGKKTLAEICQEQLDVRPYRDPNKLDDDLIAKEQAARAEDEEEPVEVDDQGRQKKRRSSMKKRKSGVGQKAQSACHICRHGEVDWKLANCTSCERKYCYGTLFRAFDLMPQQIMEDPNWQCPHCLKICSCGACRKDSSMTAYEPSGTLVGHDTKLVADPRSVESLVDFSRSNISWIEKHTRDEVPNEVNPYETARLRRLRKRAEAEHEMAQRDLGAAYADLHTHSDADADDDMEDAPYEIEHGRSVADGSAIDPQLSQVSGTNRYGIVRQSTYLPPPAAMLDGAPANGIHPDPSGLSELERNPQQLLDSIAALDDREAAEAPHRPQFVSPAAMMIDRGDGPSSHRNFGLVRDQPEAPPNQKRKHHSIDSEEDGELDDANREYQRAQTRRTIDEARRQNRFFQTQGRLRGKSLIVTLSVDMPRLNQALQDTERQTEQNASDEVATGVVFGADGAADHSAIAPVESDLPDPTIDLRFRMNGERVGSELHAQSTWRKSHGLSSSERKKAGKSRKNVSEDDVDEDGDIVDEDGDIIITEAECSPKQRKPRESAWLARKYEGEEPMAVPAEISGLTRRPRPSNGTAKSKQPISRSKPGRSDWNSVKPSTIKPGSIRSSLRRTAKPSSPVVPFAALDDEGSDSDESSFEEVDAEYNAVTVVVRPSSASQAGPGSNYNTPRPNYKGTPRSDQRSSHKSIQFADEIGHEDAKAMALRIAEGRTSETPDGSRVSSSESFGEHAQRLPRGRPSKGVRNSLARAQVD